VIRISGSVTITTTEPTPVYVVPDNYVAFLRRLAVANRAAAPATVTVLFFNGETPKPVLTLVVPAGATVVLEESELPGEACPTSIVVTTSQQPIDVSFTVELD